MPISFSCTIRSSTERANIVEEPVETVVEVVVEVELEVLDGDVVVVTATGRPPESTWLEPVVFLSGVTFGEESSVRTDTSLTDVSVVPVLEVQPKATTIERAGKITSDFIKDLCMPLISL